MSKRVSILVSEETHARLREEAERLVREAERHGGYQCPAYTDNVRGHNRPISLEAMLLILLDARQRHRERRRRSRLQRRAKGPKRPSAAAVRRLGENRG